MVLTFTCARHRHIPINQTLMIYSVRNASHTYGRLEVSGILSSHVRHLSQSIFFLSFDCFTASVSTASSVNFTSWTNTIHSGYLTFTPSISTACHFQVLHSSFPSPSNGRALPIASHRQHFLKISVTHHLVISASRLTACVVTSNESWQ